MVDVAMILISTVRYWLRLRGGVATSLSLDSNRYAIGQRRPRTLLIMRELKPLLI